MVLKLLISNKYLKYNKIGGINHIHVIVKLKFSEDNKNVMNMMFISDSHETNYF